MYFEISCLHEAGLKEGVDLLLKLLMVEVEGLLRVGESNLYNLNINDSNHGSDVVGDKIDEEASEDEDAAGSNDEQM